MLRMDLRACGGRGEGMKKGGRWIGDGGGGCLGDVSRLIYLR